MSSTNTNNNVRRQFLSPVPTTASTTDTRNRGDSRMSGTAATNLSKSNSRLTPLEHRRRTRTKSVHFGRSMHFPHNDDDDDRGHVKPPSHLMRCLRAFVNLVGLGMAATARGKGFRKVTASHQLTGYHMNHQLFDIRKYSHGETFTAFRIYVRPGGGGDNEDTVCITFALSSDGQHKWVITMMDPSNAEDLDNAFGPAVSADGDILVTATYSLREQRLVPISISDGPRESEDYNIIRDFVRNLHTIDPNDLKDFMSDDSILEDLTTYEIGSLSLPTARDLTSLPQEVTQTIHHIAMETLRRFLYPRVLLFNRTRYRRQLVEKGINLVPKISIENLQNQGMFKSWPVNLLQETISALQMISFEKDEFIIHEDEQAGSGIFFLATGSVAVLKKTARLRKDGKKAKSIGLDNSKKLVDLKPVVCFGEFAFLTEEPRTASVRANSRVDLWVLPKHDFHRIFDRLPRSLLSSVISIAFEKRNNNMAISYPMTVDILRSFAIFKNSSSVALKQIRTKLTPYAVPKNHTILKLGEPGKSMYFLRYGKCGIHQIVDSSETHVSTLSAGELFGEDAVLYHGLYSVTIKTLTNCDLWALSKDALESVMGPLPEEQEKMMGAARIARQQKLKLQALRFREFIDRLPLVSSLVSKFAFKELVSRFEAKVYKPRDVICSTAHFADRLIVLTKGSIRVGDGDWAFGECVGYTCLVPHRWAATALTVDIVEVLELPLAEYERFLKHHGVYERMLELVKALLFPRASKPQTVLEALEQTKHLRTPILYPISMSYKFNPHEFNFGLIAGNAGAVSKATSEARERRAVGPKPNPTAIVSPAPLSASDLNQTTSMGSNGGVGGDLSVDEQAPANVPPPQQQQPSSVVYTNYRSSSCEPQTTFRRDLPVPKLRHLFLGENSNSSTMSMNTTGGMAGVSSFPSRAESSFERSLSLPSVQQKPAKKSNFPSWTRGGMLIMKRNVV
eukprot:PhM_4_TR2045/c3_g2_i1/m.95506